METVKRSYSKPANFTDVGFNYADDKGNINPAILKVSKGAKFTPEEIEHFKMINASQKEQNIVAQILPFRSLMTSTLKRAGYPTPPNIMQLTKAFYDNIIKNSPIGKHFEHAEGNPVVYKNNISGNLIAALVNIIPAATSYVAEATKKSSEANDPYLSKEADEIAMYIKAKTAGLATENIKVDSKTSMNPWIIGGIILVILFFVFKK